MPRNSYTDFLERWHYLRPNAKDAKANGDAPPKEQDVPKPEQTAEKGPAQSDDADTQEALKLNEEGRRDHLGPGC
jgi:hypothetical protein